VAALAFQQATLIHSQPRKNTRLLSLRRPSSLLKFLHFCTGAVNLGLSTDPGCGTLQARISPKRRGFRPLVGVSAHFEGVIRVLAQALAGAQPVFERTRAGRVPPCPPVLSTDPGYSTPQAANKASRRGFRPLVGVLAHFEGVIRVLAQALAAARPVTGHGSPPPARSRFSSP